MKTDYSKENMEKIFKESESFTDVTLKLGLGITNNRTLKKYISKYNIDISHFNPYKKGLEKMSKKIELKEILKENISYPSSRLKERLYKEGLKERKCEFCGQGEEWNGKHISLILDHINGIKTDNRLENLRILCPNCNATLDTHCRGNAFFVRQEHKKEKKKKNIKVNINNCAKRRLIERPPYEILKAEINEFGREAVGRKYGVTGNSIRKWIWIYEKYGV